jgi:hypothetical protein
MALEIVLDIFIKWKIKNGKLVQFKQGFRASVYTLRNLNRLCSFSCRDFWLIDCFKIFIKPSIVPREI